ncbi:MAG: hypothetical protein M3Q49_06875 [Actinomycetota bacterium]|nr:hypothetical protein [Actinomycetota bacterium]
MARIKGRDRPATASLVSEPAAVERALGAFLEGFPSNAKQFEVALDAGKRPGAEDVARAAQDDNMVMIQISVDESTDGRHRSPIIHAPPRAVSLAAPAPKDVGSGGRRRSAG